MAVVQRILVPVDFSSRSEAALDHALTLAQALGASITLLHVAQPPPSMSGIVPGSDDDDRAARDAVQHSLDQLVARAKSRGFQQIDARIESGLPIEVILDTAREGGFQMIAMATRGRTGLRRLIIGSVTEGVLRHAACPVVTLHLPENEGD